MGRSYQCDLQGEYTMVSSRLPSLALMRGGVADVNPFLVSRNTLGNRKTANSKSQRQMSNGDSGKVVVVCTWLCGSGMMAIHVSELKLSSLSSRNTLGDTSHNSNKLKQNWVKFGWRKCMVGTSMWKWSWWLKKKQPPLSSRNTLGDSTHYSRSH